MTAPSTRTRRGIKQISVVLASVILLALSACTQELPPPAEPKSPPGPPTAVTAVAGDGEATVSWTAPGFDYGENNIEYTVTSSGGQTATTKSTTTTVTGLENGTAYTFTVTVTTNRGTSDPSEPSNEVTPAAQ